MPKVVFKSSVFNVPNPFVASQKLYVGEKSDEGLLNFSDDSSTISHCSLVNGLSVNTMTKALKFHWDSVWLGTRWPNKVSNEEEV